MFKKYFTFVWSPALTSAKFLTKYLTTPIQTFPDAIVSEVRWTKGIFYCYFNCIACKIFIFKRFDFLLQLKTEFFSLVSQAKKCILYALVMLVKCCKKKNLKKPIFFYHSKKMTFLILRFICQLERILVMLATFLKQESPYYRLLHDAASMLD